MQDECRNRDVFMRGFWVGAWLSCVFPGSGPSLLFSLLQVCFWKEKHPCEIWVPTSISAMLCVHLGAIGGSLLDSARSNCKEELRGNAQHKTTASDLWLEMGLWTWTRALLSLFQAFGFTIVKIAVKHQWTKKRYEDTKTLNLNLPTRLQCCRQLLWLLDGPEMGVFFLPEYSA